MAKPDTRKGDRSATKVRPVWLSDDVWKAALARPEEMDAVAARLRVEAAAGRTPALTPQDFVITDWGSDSDTLDPDFEAEEGSPLLARRYRRERNQTIRKRKLAAVRAAGLPSPRSAHSSRPCIPPTREHPDRLAGRH